MLKIFKNATVNFGTEIPAIYIPGDEKRAAVIMAHGIMGSKNEYLDTQARIAEKLEYMGIASLRIDFRGHGDSDRTMKEFSLDTQIQDLCDSIRWMQNKKYSSFILLGISFGAPPAMIVSALYKQIVKKCVLIAPVTDYKKTFINTTLSLISVRLLPPDTVTNCPRAFSATFLPCLSPLSETIAYCCPFARVTFSELS